MKSFTDLVLDMREYLNKLADKEDTDILLEKLDDLETAHEEACIENYADGYSEGEVAAG